MARNTERHEPGTLTKSHGAKSHGVNSVLLTFFVIRLTLRRMARPLRVEFANAAYHVTARGNERRIIYRDDKDRQRFLETLGEACERFGLVVHAYCLMPNHYHLLAQTPRANLSRAIGWLQTTYCIRYNRRHHRCGHLVQGRFKAHLIEADAYAKQLIRYVHLNPVRPHDRRKPIPSDRRPYFEKYLWNSHRAYAGTAGKDQPQWLCTDWLSYWGEQRGRASKAYAADVADCFGEPIANPLADLRGGLVLGGQSLWKKVRKLLDGQSNTDALHWKRRDDQEKVQQKIAKLVEDEAESRVRLWARVRLGGERLSDLARELGYADGSGVHQVARRLEAEANDDVALRRKLEGMRKAAMS
jgi:putative transposase